MPILDQIPLHSSVVVIRLRSLGDTILITPALELLKNFRPDLSITVVVEDRFVSILEGNPALSDVISVGHKRKSKIASIVAIRRHKPHLCLNLHGGLTSALMTAVSGARFKVGFEHFRPAFPYDIRVPRAQKILGREPNETIHTVEHHASIMFFLGVPRVEIPRTFLPITPQKPSVATPYAVVHIGATYSTKQWPAKHFLQISHFLRESCQLEPVVIAGPGQETLLADFSEFSCQKDLTLNELKNTIAKATLFVGNDSGPAHIAAALGIPAAIVFGSSNSAIWKPWRGDHEIIETKWDCKPCPGDRCYVFDEPHCILSVDVKRVKDAINRLRLAGSSDLKS